MAGLAPPGYPGHPRALGAGRPAEPARWSRLPRGRHGGAPDRRVRPVPADRVLPHRKGDLSRFPDPGSVPHDPGPRQHPGARSVEPGPGAPDRRAARRGAPGTARGRLAHGGRPGGPAARRRAFPAGLDVPPAVRLGARGAGRRGADSRSRTAVTACRGRPEAGPRRGAGRASRPRSAGCAVRCRAARSASPIESITPDLTPLLWRYLREELGIDEVTPADVAREWYPRISCRRSPTSGSRASTRSCYLSPPLWRAPGSDGEQPGPARTRPIIRLEDGRQVAPFDR